jgi:hypothetical protein
MRRMIERNQRNAMVCGRERGSAAGGGFGNFAYAKVQNTGQFLDAAAARAKSIHPVADVASMS